VARLAISARWLPFLGGAKNGSNGPSGAGVFSVAVTHIFECPRIANVILDPVQMAVNVYCELILLSLPRVLTTFFTPRSSSLILRIPGMTPPWKSPKNSKMARLETLTRIKKCPQCQNTGLTLREYHCDMMDT